MAGKHLIAIGIAAGTIAAVVGALACVAGKYQGGDTGTLTLLVIGGAIALVAAIALIATIYNMLGLTDRDQAMALPEGSVRAVIALLLLVLFAMLAIFFYERLQTVGSTVTLSNQTQAQLTDFIAKHPDISNLSITVAPPPATPPADSSAANKTTPPAVPPLPATPPPSLYNISYGGGNAGASDFAKTLMAALETLLTTVIGFYFGAKTATSSAAATAQQLTTGTGPPMTLSTIDPATGPVGALTLKINGANLNPVVNAHIERVGAGSVPLSNVVSNPTQVVGQLAITQAMTGGAPWDVVVSDTAGNTQRLKGALTL